ncbi:MAG: hypothetical protein IAE78_20025 [Myxococcus sp.]|nr:hypothetical protein [Myxococcus sp.]
MRASFLVVLLSSCLQTASFGRGPEPSGRLLPGTVPCSSPGGCPADAGACFVSLFDGGSVCSGASSLSACDVIECDPPAGCLCLLSLPPQCGCSITIRER